MTIRTAIMETLKEAMKQKEIQTVETCRLIQAAIKDKDIDARTKPGKEKGLDDGEIILLLQSMIKSRRESITLYEERESP